MATMMRLDVDEVRRLAAVIAETHDGARCEDGADHCLACQAVVFVGETPSLDVCRAEAERRLRRSAAENAAIDAGEEFAEIGAARDAVTTALRDVARVAPALAAHAAAAIDALANGAPVPDEARAWLLDPRADDPIVVATAEALRALARGHQATAARVAGYAHGLADCRAF